MNMHLRYWLARLRNEFRQLTLQEPDEADCVEQVMSGLKRDPTLRKIIEEKEAELRAVGKFAGNNSEER